MSFDLTLNPSPLQERDFVLLAPQHRRLPRRRYSTLSPYSSARVLDLNLGSPESNRHGTRRMRGSGADASSVNLEATPHSQTG